MVVTTNKGRAHYKDLMRSAVETTVFDSEDIDIVPYSHTADSEFALKAKHNSKLSNVYEDWKDVYCMWGQNSKRAMPKFTSDNKLKDAIRIRDDGFILNMTTGMVLHGSERNITVVKGLLGVPLGELRDMHQKIYEALRIKV